MEQNLVITKSNYEHNPEAQMYSIIKLPGITKKSQHVAKDKYQPTRMKSFNSVATDQLHRWQLIINTEADTINKTSAEWY